MKIDHLITMANQIGDFFKSFPDQEQSKQDIAQHLLKFWAKSMRDQITLYVQNNNGEGLHALVKDAIREHLTASSH
jgi:formate dehydrogenase subunit delta